MAHQTVVFVGNCIAEMVGMGLASAAEVTRRFEVVVVPLHLKRLEDEEVRLALARAGCIFLQEIAAPHLQRIDAWRRAECGVVMLPNLGMRGIWPFSEAREFRDSAVDRISPNAPEQLHDGALAAMRALEPDPERRLRRLRALDFPLAERIGRIMESQRRFLEYIDSVADTHIGRFILFHMQERQLFYNSTHPAGLIFQKLCEFAWRRIGLGGDPPAFRPAIPDGLDYWRHASCPVNPGIASRLGLTWATDHALYQCEGLGLITWEGWVRWHMRTYG